MYVNFFIEMDNYSTYNIIIKWFFFIIFFMKKTDLL